MVEDRTGQVVVLFISERTGEDPDGYAAAADAMEALAAQQPGYRGIDYAGTPDGVSITLSYWADEASAVAWRKQAEHTQARNAGRDRWYSRYALHVAEIGRSYDWERE
jgi:heme-degrading monooxygenase HmoA